MDPDSGDFFKASKLAKITLLTLIFTTCYFYKARQREPVLKLTVSKKDSSVSLTVKEKPAIKKKKKNIYLSFDDGPNKGTQNVLDIINKEEVDATLFLVGGHVYGSRQQNALYDSILSSRFVEIANHSYTHAKNRYAKFYAVPDSVVKDFERCADSLQLSSNIIRTPGRNIWRINNISCTDIKSSLAAADSLEHKGYKVMGWDIEWHYNDDLKALQTSDEMAREVDSMFTYNLTKVPNHLVLLAHDQVYADSEDSSSLHQFLKTLKERGEYNFSSVKNYPGINNEFATDTSLTKK